MGSKVALAMHERLEIGTAAVPAIEILSLCCVRQVPTGVCAFRRIPNRQGMCQFAGSCAHDPGRVLSLLDGMRVSAASKCSLIALGSTKEAPTIAP